MITQVQEHKSVGMVFPIVIENNPSNSSLGKGWYPTPNIDDLIENNINALLIHEIGQRLNQEDFGTRLMSCIEEPNTQALAFLVNAFIKEAISRYEDRVVYKFSKILRDGSKLYILLEYTVRQTNMSDSIILSYDIEQ